MSEVKVSIITIVFNGVSTLEQTLKSVIEQTYQNIEYLIIDGESSDGTLDIIRKYEQHIDFWSSEPDKGIYDAMNKGINKSTGEWLMFLNADDYLIDNDVISDFHDYLSDCKNDLVYGVAKVIRDSIGFKYEFERGRKVGLKDFYYDQPIIHQAVFMKRYLFNEGHIGLYNISLLGAGDYEWFVRYFSQSKYQSKFVSRKIVVFRLGGASETFTLRNQLDKLQISKQYFPMTVHYVHYLKLIWTRVRVFVVKRVKNYWIYSMYLRIKVAFQGDKN